jgi:hypothetical protein
MIIVVGEPRSGTSLMMQTLVALGFIPFGHKFPKNRPIASNPRGYWEHADAFNNSIHEKAHLSDEQCVKIGLRAFLEKPRIAVGCKIIVCTRPAAQIADAQIAAGFAENRERIIASVQRNYQRLNSLVTANPSVPVLQVALGTFRSNPTATVDAIIAFVGPLPTRGRQAAIDNVAGGGE